jgi:hypothetical protein
VAKSIEEVALLSVGGAFGDEGAILGIGQQFFKRCF